MAFRNTRLKAFDWFNKLKVRIPSAIKAKADEFEKHMTPPQKKTPNTDVVCKDVSKCLRFSLTPDPSSLSSIDARAVRFWVSGLRFRVLDVLRPRGATWSGQLISSSPGPSGGRLMTHLLQRQRAQQPKKPPPFLLSRTCTPYRPPPQKKMWTQPKNTRRTRGHQQRGTE